MFRRERYSVTFLAIFEGQDRGTIDKTLLDSRHAKETLVTALHPRAHTWQAQLSRVKKFSSERESPSLQPKTSFGSEKSSVSKGNDPASLERNSHKRVHRSRRRRRSYKSTSFFYFSFFLLFSPHFTREASTREQTSNENSTFVCRFYVAAFMTNLRKKKFLSHLSPFRAVFSRLEKFIFQEDNFRVKFYRCFFSL